MTTSAEDSSIKERALKTVVKGAGISFLGQAISNVSLYITRLVTARYLGPEEYGLIFLGMSILNIIIVFATLSLESAVVRYVSYYAGKNDKKKVKGVFLSSLKISIPIGILAFILTFYLSDYIAVNIFHNQAFAPVVMIFSVVVPFFAAYKTFEAGIIASKRMDLCAGIRDVFRPLLTLILVFLFLFFGFGLIGAAVSYALGFIVLSIVSFFVTERKIFPFVTSKVRATPMKKKMLKYSLPVLFYSIVWTFVLRIDTLMIGALKTAGDVGLYQTALPTSQFIIIPSVALGALFLPVISELLAKKKTCDINETYKVVSKWSFYVVFPMFLVLFMYSGAVINMLFGYEYIQAETALSILSIASLIFMLNGFSVNMLNLLEKNNFLFLNSLVTLVAAVSLNYLLIPAYGINGAAIAMVISYSIMTTLSILEARHFCGAHPFSRDILKAVVAGIVSVLIIYNITRTLFTELNIFILAPMMLVFMGLYFAMLLILRGIGKEDIMILRAMEKKTGLRIGFLRKIMKRFI
jgi:O-antigen/teichoic acid export membrane protein